MSERRYNDREIREVFERAAREQEHAARRTEPDGLTLDEMREIAVSAGIEPEFVERAAQSVALGEPEQGRMTLGPIPRGVFRTEFLPSPPSDALWQALVADLRRTFDAQGRVTTVGQLREWRNGNLRVSLEPAGEGSRLHLRTRRDRVQGQVALFSAAFVSALAATMGTIDTDAGKLAFGVLMAFVAMLGAGTLWASQRRWAATRERQMEEIAARAAQRQDGDAASEASLQADPALDTARLDASLLDGEVALDTRPVDARRRGRS